MKVLTRANKYLHVHVLFNGFPYYCEKEYNLNSEFNIFLTLQNVFSKTLV